MTMSVNTWVIQISFKSMPLPFWLFGEINAVDEESARVTVSLSLNEETFTPSRHHLLLVSEDDRQRTRGIRPPTKQQHGHHQVEKNRSRLPTNVGRLSMLSWSGEP